MWNVASNRIVGIIKVHSKALYAIRSRELCFLSHLYQSLVSIEADLRSLECVVCTLRCLPQDDVWEAVSVVTATDPHSSGEKP